MASFFSDLRREINYIFNSQLAHIRRRKRATITPNKAIQLWHKRYAELRPKPFTLASSSDALRVFDEYIYLPWVNEKNRHLKAFVIVANANPKFAYKEVLRGRVLWA